MGPRSRERGNLLLFGVAWESRLASMGPRSRERGNPPAMPATRPMLLLQWGRAHVSAEMWYALLGATYDRLLQWGRAHVSAEMRRPRKQRRSRTRLQWGRAHVSAEINHSPAYCPSRSASF